jgi:hypothetical protein
VFLTRALKAPTLRESVTRLAERARSESWTHEEFLVACLQGVLCWLTVVERSFALLRLSRQPVHSYCGDTWPAPRARGRTSTSAPMLRLKNLRGSRRNTRCFM